MGDKEEKEDHDDMALDDDDDDKPLSQKKDGDAAGDGDDDDDSGDDGKSKGARRDRRSRDRKRKERDRRDRDRKRREEKKASEGQGKKWDDAILDKDDDPHVIMEVYQWPMPLPEDAGRIRAYPQPGQTHEFWETYEEYFKPVTEDAVQKLLSEPDLDSDNCFLMPRLGTHYMHKQGGAAASDAWGPDDMEEDRKKSVTTTSGRVVGGKRKATDPVAAADTDKGPGALLSARKMCMRMLSAFIQQDTVASGAEEHNPAGVLQAAADAASTREADALLAYNIERRMRVELANLGLMESPDIEYDAPNVREDDQICAELRYQQQQLRKHIEEREAAASASRKKLLARVEQGYQRERLLSELQQAARNVEACILPKFKIAKGVRPTDLKKHMDVWDKCYHRVKQNLSGTSRRKGFGGGAVGMHRKPDGGRTLSPQKAAAQRPHGSGMGPTNVPGQWESTGQGHKVAQFASMNRKT